MAGSLGRAHHRIARRTDDDLTSSILLRSQLVRLMKTVRTILEKAKQDSVRWIAQTMINQLVEIMPELSEVGVWNVGGRQRRRSELGVAAERRLATDCSSSGRRRYAQSRRMPLMSDSAAVSLSGAGTRRLAVVRRRGASTVP